MQVGPNNSLASDFSEVTLPQLPNEAAQPKPQGWGVWFVNTLPTRVAQLVIRDGGASEVIVQKKGELIALFSATTDDAEEVNTKIEKIDAVLSKKIEEFLEHAASKNGIQEDAINPLKHNLSLWIKATLFTIVVNVLKAANLQNNNEQKSPISLVLNYLANQTGSDLDSLTAELKAIDAQIEDHDQRLKELKKQLTTAKNGQDLSTRIQDLTKNIQDGEILKKNLETHREELFYPLRDALLKIALPNGKEDIAIPYFPVIDVKQMLYSYADDFLPSFFAEKASELMKSNALPVQDLSETERQQYQQLKGRERLEGSAERLFEVFKSKIWGFIENNSFKITEFLEGNIEFLEGNIEFSEMAVLSEQLKEAIHDPSMQKQVSPLLFFAFKTFILFTLRRMAINGPVPDGDALTNIILLLRQRMGEQKLENFLGQLPTYYQSSTRLREIESKKSRVKKEMIDLSLKNPSVEKEKIDDKGKEKVKEGEVPSDNERFNELKEELENLSQEQKEERQKIDEAGQKKELEDLLMPFVNQIIVDGGLQGSIWENLAKQFLPEALLDIQLEIGQAYLSTAARQENLRNRLGSDDLNQVATKLGRVAVHIGDTALGGQTEKILNFVLEKAELIGASNPPVKPDMMPSAAEVISSKSHDDDLLLPLMGLEIAAQLTEIFEAVVVNLQAIQTENPRFLEGLGMSFIEEITTHLSIMNRAKNAQGKQHLHEVGPDVLRTAFTDAGKLHPAMGEGKKEFYTKLSLWILGLIGKNGPDDFSVGFGLNELVWNKITASLQDFLENTIEGMFTEEKMKGILTQFAHKLYKALEEETKKTTQQPEVNQPVKAGPADTDRQMKSVPADKEKMIKFIEELVAFLPQTSLTSFLNKDFVKNLSVEQLENALKKAVEGIKLDELFVKIATEASGGFMDKYSKVDANEAVENPEAQSNVDHIESFETEAEKIVESFEQKVDTLLGKYWWGKLIKFFFGWAIRWIFAKLQQGVRDNAVHFNQNITKVPLHANLVYQMADVLVHRTTIPNQETVG